MDGSFEGESDTTETADALERAKAGGPVDPPVARAIGARGEGAPRRISPELLKIAIVVPILGAIVFLLLMMGGSDGEESPFVYSQRVAVVAAAPSEHLGRTLRVEGNLQNGSVRFREEPCEWRFVLEETGQQMPVEFPQCVVPDTFRDGMGISVVVEGRLREDGSFLATQVIPRCPSRYEMEQRQQAGEAMPHAAPPAS